MNEQLTLQGDKVMTCKSCGLARPDRATATYTNITNPHCTSCREEKGEVWEDCYICQESCLEGDLIAERYHFTPWDEEETESGFKYCLPCGDEGKGFDYDDVFWCDQCERPIALDNGRMCYYRILNECEQVCLRCIEETLKAEGIAGIEDGDRLERVFAGKPFGMFFNVGELEAEGWEPDPLYQDYLLDENTAIKIGARAHGWHKAGRLIIIGYERLSIVGDEGYVTLYTKEAKN